LTMLFVCEERNRLGIPVGCVLFFAWGVTKYLTRRRSLAASGAAALLALALVYGVYWLQLRQVELQKTVDVVVPKDFIPAGSTLTRDLLEYKPIYAGALQSGMIREMAEAVGQETMVPLGSGEPLLVWKLDRLHLLPDKEHSTFQIPKEYLLSVSNGIRAGDEVRIYVSDPEGEPRRLFSHNITVASVKSAANVEVDNPKQSNLLSRANGDAEKMYVSRLEANGSIDQINLNLSEEEWMEIDKLCSSGKARLVIALTAAAIERTASGAETQWQKEGTS